MPAYIVGRLKVWSRDWVEEYLPKVTALIHSHDGRFLGLSGDIQVIEGKEPAPDAMIILDFLDQQAALAFR